MTKAKVFDEMHGNLAEPFDYSKRAAEILRHRFVYETVKLLQPRPRRLLDIGCSRGQLTAKLTEIPDVLIAIDVSRIAVAGAREACHRRGRQSRAGLFVVGSATALPFRRDSFDCMVLSDGLHSWQLSEHERRAALREATDALMLGGHVVLTEYLRPEGFTGFVAQIQDGALAVLSIRYLHDRLWYQFESWFKAIKGRPWVRRLLRSLSLARSLQLIARLFGKYGSRHICVVARRAR
jgi:ubiquinone/menaquinone biosynthesis C-methylase UbiE